MRMTRGTRCRITLGRNDASVPHDLDGAARSSG
jgi:hypothetical protein